MHKSFGKTHLLRESGADWGWFWWFYEGSSFSIFLFFEKSQQKIATIMRQLFGNCLRFALPAEAGFEAWPTERKERKEQKSIIWLIFNRFSLIFAGFHWFSLIFIDFHWIFIEFEWIFIDFHWFSLIFIDSQRPREEKFPNRPSIKWASRSYRINKIWSISLFS